MLIALRDTATCASVLVNLDHVKTIEPARNGGTLVYLAGGGCIATDTTIEAWGEMPFVTKMFRGRL